MERRRSPRQEISGLRVHLPVAGRVLNASAGGVAIEATDSLKCGWSYAFKMGEGSRVVRIPGKVAWCKLVGTRGAGNGDVKPLFELGIALAGSIWSERQTYFYP